MVEITNDFEKEVYLKYIEYMEIPNCDKAYDMFFRDVLKTCNPDITNYLNPNDYTPAQIEQYRVISDENGAFLALHFVKFYEKIANICTK